MKKVKKTRAGLVEAWQLSDGENATENNGSGVSLAG
jgi:hypothetical protein